MRNRAKVRRSRWWWLAAMVVACLAGAAGAQAAPFVYVANNLSSSVSQYRAMGGALAPLVPATVAVGFNPRGVAVSPDGKSVYVTNAGSDDISQYDVGPGGVLSPKSPATVATGIDPQGVAVSPDGKSVYVTNFPVSVSGSVSQYDVGAGGVLSPKNPATVAAGVGAVRRRGEP